MLSNEVYDRYRKYVKYTIYNKGIDPRDGLKTSQRMVLYAAYKIAKTRIKSARLVGEVLGNYWPHGDQSIYETIANLVKKGLIDGYGEWGDFNHGTVQAAMRYTELKISDLCLELLFEPGGMACVEYTNTYDGKLEVPVYLPAKLPIALLIGVYTIGIEEMPNIMIPQYTIASVKKSYEAVQMNDKNPASWLKYQMPEDCVIKGNVAYPRLSIKNNEVVIEANNGKFNYSKIMEIFKKEKLDVINLSSEKTQIIIKSNIYKTNEIADIINRKLANPLQWSLSGYGFNDEFNMDIFNPSVSINEYLRLFHIFRSNLDNKINKYNIKKINDEINLYKMLEKYKNCDIFELQTHVPEVSDMKVGTLTNLINSNLNDKIRVLESKKDELTANSKIKNKRNKRGQ